MEKRSPVKLMERTHDEAREVRRGNYGRSSPVGQREKAKTLVSGRFRVTDEVDYVRMADGPEVSWVKEEEP